MMENSSLDQLRNHALDRIKRAERNFKLVILGAALFEGVFLIAFLLLADLSNRAHLLLLIATVGSYSMVIIGIVALGVHINRGILRVLKAVETVQR